jgi:hypothetical protein
MSDLQRDLKRVEESLSGLNAHVGYIMIDGTDAKPKLDGLGEDIDKVERDVRRIRRKLESRQMS